MRYRAQNCVVPFAQPSPLSFDKPRVSLQDALPCIPLSQSIRGSLVRRVSNQGVCQVLATMRWGEVKSRFIVRRQNEFRLFCD